MENTLFNRFIVEDTKKKYKEYLASGKWKCTKSPTGAHHYICETIRFSYPMTTTKQTCKYCQYEIITCVEDK